MTNAVLHPSFFCSLSWIRPRFVNTAKPYSCRGAPACGKRQIPVLSKIFAFIICRSSRLRETANSRFIKNFCVYHLPELPLAGNGKFPSKERLVVIFSKYCSTRKLPLLRQARTGLYRMPDKNKTNRGLTASFWLIHCYARGLYVKY